MRTSNRSAFLHYSINVSVTDSNRRGRTRTHDGVAGVAGDRRAYSDLTRQREVKLPVPEVATADIVLGAGCGHFRMIGSDGLPHRLGSPAERRARFSDSALHVGPLPGFGSFLRKVAGRDRGANFIFASAVR